MTPVLDDATATLKDTLTAHQCIYLVERRRSRSNETAIVDFLIVTPAGTIASIGPDVAAVCHVTYDTGVQGATVKRPQTAEMFVDRLSIAILEIEGALTSKWL